MSRVVQISREGQDTYLGNSVAAVLWNMQQDKCLVYPVDGRTNEPRVKREQASYSRRQVEAWANLYPDDTFRAVPRSEVMSNPYAFVNASQSFEDTLFDQSTLDEQEMRRALARHRATEKLALALEADKPPMQVLKASDLRAMREPSYVVQGLLTEATVCLWSGTGSVGKTAALMGIAVAMGNDVPFLGRPVKQGRVLFVEAEGTSYLQYRLDSWLTHMDVAGDEHIDFATADAFTLKGVRELALANGYDLIVLDTFSSLFAVESENDNALISAQIKRLKQLRDELPGVCIVLVHHTTNTTDSKGRKSSKARGASAFRDDTDTTVVQTGLSSDFVISTDPRDNGKQRDGAAPARITGLSIREVDKSVVVVANDEQAQAQADRQTIELLKCFGDDEQLASGDLHERFKANVSRSNTTYDAVRTRAVEHALLTKGDGKRDPYVLTEAGRQAVKVGVIKRRLPLAELAAVLGVSE